MRTPKLLAATAVMIGLAAPVHAVYYPGSTDFEGDSPLADGCWSNVVDAAIVADGSVANAPRAQNLPPSFDKTSRTKVMEVDADEAIVRKLMDDNTAAAASTIYADFLINPLPIAADDTPEAGDDDKILIYTRVSQSGAATNLCVYAKDVNGSAQEFVLTKTFGADEWHRIVVKATAEGYQVYCDGTAAANLCKTLGDVDTFYALNAGNPVTSVGFVGTGHVDDIILTDFDPAVPVTTLTWDDSLVSVSYTVNGEDGDVLTPSDGSYSCQIPAGATVVMTGNNGFRSFSTTGTTLETPTGLAYYTTGDGTSANPYEIPTYEALVAMKDAVASDASYRSAHYVQTADIDGTGKAAFAGIGTYNATPTSGTPFTGTYDGQGYKITNIDFTQRNYGGVFNQVNGGTIKNLTVSNITCSAYSASVNDGEFGFAIIGNAGNGATLTNLVAEGVFASASQPATHNVAGIVIRACAGGTGTLIKDCTNNATLYGSYTKIGGICAITQYKIAGGVVTFDGCVNNGGIISSRTTSGVTGYAGILGYNDDNSVLVNCSNTGSIVNNSGANTDKDGALVGWAYTKDANSVRSLTDQGGNSTAKTDKMLASTSQLANVTGFLYATVENGVATTITGTPVAGGEYLLEGNAAPVIELGDDETVAFDTALGYTLDEIGITAAESLVVSSSTSGSVTTFTADTPKVAQIGNNKYDSVAEAVAAAQSGDTVELLADVTLDARVEPNVGANTSLTIDLGGHTITREGTSGNGSVFDVRSGNVVITNGVIDCTQDDTDIAKDGVYAITSRSGSNVTLADLDITVNSECGACAYPFAGSTMTIESGTYANVTTTPYRYNTAITGMAVNQPNNATQNLFIKGGSFSQYDPQLGDDSGAMTDFTDDGFVAIDDGNGHFVVQTGYNVTFDANGGTPAPESQRVAAGNLVTAPASAPTKAGDDTVVYVFNAWQLDNADYDFTVAPSADITLVAAYTATSLVAAKWIGGAQGDWDDPDNWDIGYVPTKATVVTFTNNAQVAIGNSDRCNEMVLSNANVVLVRDANATVPILRFYAVGENAVSVASGATGSLAVNGLALFNECKDENDMTIGCDFEINGDVTFRGINIIPNQLAASFTITGKTTISADALVKTIDWGITKFQGGIEVAKGVTAKLNTTANGGAQIGTGVTLVANDGEGAATTIWLMQIMSNSRGVSLVNGAKVSVDAAHAGDCFVKKDTAKEVSNNYDVYTATRNPTVYVTAGGVTVTGVENGQKVIPGTDLVINVSGFADGYEPSVKILKHEDYSELLITNAVPFTYTMPDFDIDVVADATPPSYNDPEGSEIQDQGLIGWLSDNGFTQGDIAALGNDAAATDKLYECWLLNCSIKAENPGGALSSAAIAVTNGVVSIAVQLDRQNPLGFINGVLHVYGTDDLADDFSLISEEIVGISEGDSTFATAPSEGAVTQSVTATFSLDDVSATFFKAVIEFPSSGDTDEPEPDEPEPDPEE